MVTHSAFQSVIIAPGTHGVRVSILQPTHIPLTSHSVVVVAIVVAVSLILSIALVAERAASVPPPVARKFVCYGHHASALTAAVCAVSGSGSCDRL